MRIRSIKPEFWVSESVGRLTRDARLLFIGLWSFADDSGRGRGAFPAISGALFSYDQDADKHLESWFAELERENMVRRYKAGDGNWYYDIPNWLKHQKIEKPSRPIHPPFTECSPTITRTLPEISPLEQGAGSREQGAVGAPPSVTVAVPTESDIIAYGSMHGATEDTCRRFWRHYEGNNKWLDAHGKLVKWTVLLLNWRDTDRAEGPAKGRGNGGMSPIGMSIAIEKKIEGLKAKLKEAESQGIVTQEEEKVVRDIKRQIHEAELSKANIPV